jgi:hypothetical protein
MRHLSLLLLPSLLLAVRSQPVAKPMDPMAQTALGVTGAACVIALCKAAHSFYKLGSDSPSSTPSSTPHSSPRISPASPPGHIPLLPLHNPPHPVSAPPSH